MAEAIETHTELTAFSDLADQIADLTRRVSEQQRGTLKEEVTSEMELLDAKTNQGFEMCAKVVRRV